MLPIQPQQVVQAFSREFFRLTILPTGNCNLSCVYCYEDHIEVNRNNFATKTNYIPAHMKPLSRPHINGIKNLITYLHRNGLKFLVISWFGGEPLLEPKIIEEIHNHANSLGIKKITGHATTNYTAVNEKMLSKYCAMGLNEFQVSLDGAEEDHNKTRIGVGGKGSYKKIMTNLLIAKESSHQFSIQLRIHIHPQNIKNMAAFLIYIRDTFLVDKRFTVDLKPVGDYGGESVKDMKVLGWGEEETIVENLQKYLIPKKQKKPTRQAQNQGCYVCYAASPNSYVILNTGEVAKCTVTFKVVGALFENGEIRTNDGKVNWYYRGWDRVKASGGKDTKLLTCPHAEK